MTPPDGHGSNTVILDSTIEVLRDRILPQLKKALPKDKTSEVSRGEVSREVKSFATNYLSQQGIELNLLDQRDLVGALTNSLLGIETKPSPPPPPTPATSSHFTPPPPAPEPEAEPVKKREVKPIGSASRTSVDQAKTKLQPLILERIDTSAAARMAREDLARDLKGIVGELLGETKIQLNAAERIELVEQLLNDMLGLGPLEPLLADENISEVMVNGPKQVYCESKGKLTLTDVKFRDNSHVLSIATRIVTAIGRRIDESSPLCDARLADGSRVNIIIPPLAIDGPSITIRKFSKKKITLDSMVQFGSISPQMAQVLRICGRCRLNILISGGTGSGKTTLLNALSQMIDHGERVVTIEDAAELQLQQPHVVRLETRPANLEGHGEITMRDLLKNAL
ncbi:MAG: CpaF family protein, partial [Bdellovibrionales bacterium]